MDSQGALPDMAWTAADALITPQPSHAVLPGDDDVSTVAKVQADRVNTATHGGLTPPPSTQVPTNNHAKSRTPTPTYSHISTPPPTVDVSSQASNARVGNGTARTMTNEQIEGASAEELKTKVSELQAAYQEAKMSAAHYQLQYQMLAQETAAAVERMGVEARMAEYESKVIQVAEQTRRAVGIAQPARPQDGTIPVQKDLYQRMCLQIQHLNERNAHLESEQRVQAKTVARQEDEIASLSDRVILMRDRIRENREHQTRHRLGTDSRQVTATPRSVYSTPRRPVDQAQPFAALLQASEMASQEASTGRSTAKRGSHTRNVHSMSSLPATPSRATKQPPLFQTPSGRQQPMKVPATAPVHRTLYAQQPIVPHTAGPQSEGTVSASDNDDSEAETEILEPDAITESQATRVASQMLRSSQEMHHGDMNIDDGTTGRQGTKTSNVRQTKLFGQVRKPGIVRAGADEEERPVKRRGRVGEGVGLGIAGLRG
ncbi:hypothetical protein B0A48_04036 [Cryoendolithus antarcticus]|uniref:Uncharacterized protein n=1 Tax=Cryoendolithus antarcticus TaxID=1507870 RepID=A0A1V8THA3_9PEZI|nr:hypothetical protein B0A48_04036 [Cryoendolithus antarcticus]